jgi:hypothetical protein
MKYLIKYTKRKIKGEYWGMNKFAFSSIFHKQYPHRSNIILIYDGLSKKDKKETRKHEEEEIHQMRDCGLSYKEAHKIAEEYQSKKQKSKCNKN